MCALRCRSASGASLLVALVVLAMMSMGALAMVRAVGTGLLIAGNFAFRQAAVLASESGSEAAVSWLSAHVDSADVLTDQPAAGYYASVASGIDLTGSGPSAGPGTVSLAVDWLNDHCGGRQGITCLQAAPALAADPSGHGVRYLIQRLCRGAGSPDAASNSCLLYSSAKGSGASHGQLSYGASKSFQTVNAVYYRITVHVRGPRGTTAFTQTLVHY